ncbi:MAG: fibronectin type III domain-containing protein [Acutalibacteraceae bacterium]|nr:fibronectin type III domain-containing protein [Acutalibacteraceae bacterium]
MKKLLYITFLILTASVLLFSSAVFATDGLKPSVPESTTVEESSAENESTTLHSPAVPEGSAESPIVSLNGKTIFIVGNSHLYYGNCVIYGDNGKKDTGYLYRIIKSFGEEANVIDHTYSGKSLDYIYTHHLSKISPDILNKVDYVILSEAGNINNGKLLEHCRKIMALFPEKTEFFYSCHAIIYDWDRDATYNCFDSLRQEGIRMIDWGRMIYDIYTGAVKVPGGIMSYNRCSFIKDNIYYDKKTNTTKGDDKHPNPLTGYISAQAIYTALTNRTALYTDYSFCSDKKLNKLFDFDDFISKHYNAGKSTNFDKIFSSPRDMAGIQKLIDIYNEKESRHAVFEAQGVKPTCLNAGLTNGYHCTVCNTVFKNQEMIAASGEHTPVYTNAVTPTCKKDGKTASIRCAVCSQVLVKSSNISSPGHLYTEKVIDDKHLISPASYSSAAVYKYDCIRCSSSSEKHTYTHGSKLTLSSPKEAAATQTLKSITLTWSKVKKADGYRIKRYDSKSGSWVTAANTKDRIYNIDKLSPGKEYTFRIYPYIRENGKKIYSKAYCEISTATRPANVDKITAKRTESSITLMWNKVKGATGYTVYRNVNGVWEKLGKTDSTSYKVKKLTPGKSYQFSVRPYIKTASGTVLSPSGRRYTTSTKPAKVTLSVTSSVKGTAKLSWSNVKNETGYQVYYSDKASGAYIKLKDYKANITVATISKLKSSKTYYFKVRAFKTTESGNNIYGAFSDVKKLKIK